MKPNTPIFWAKDFFRPLLVYFLFLSNGDGEWLRKRAREGKNNNYFEEKNGAEFE